MRASPTFLLAGMLAATPRTAAASECVVEDGASTCPHGNTAGSEIKKGIFLDITKQGFDQFTELAQVFVPETVPIDTSGLSQRGSVGNVLLGGSYSVQISNLIVAPELERLSITPKPGGLAREGSALYKNGRLDVNARLRTDVNSPADPARVQIEIRLQFLFFDIGLLDQGCDFWVDKNVLGPVDAGIGLTVGPKKTFNGQTARACRPGEVCGDTRPGIVCDTPCIETNPNQPDPFCTLEDPLDCPVPFDPTAEDVDFRCGFVRGGPICIEDPANPPVPSLCWEAEKRATDPTTPIPRDCNGYVEPWVDSAGVEIDLTQLSTGLFDVLGRDCDGFLGFLLDIAEFIGVGADIGPVLAATVEPAAADALADVLPDIQDTLARSLWITETVDLLGTDLSLNVGPGNLYVNDNGLRLEMWSQIGGTRSQPAACVAPYIGVGKDGSRRTVPTNTNVDTFPALGQAFAGSEQAAQVTALIDDDVLNQALFGVWRDGLLCQELASDNLPLDLPAGIELDTALIRAFAQGELDELFPEAGPLILKTRPRKAPVMDIVDGPDGAEIEVGLEEFGLDIYGELDGRFMRMVGLQLDGDLGANVTPSYDRDTSLLGVDLAFDLSDIQPVPLFNDLAPDASEPIANGLGNILRTIAGSLLDDALGDPIEVQLPRIFGVGVDDAFFGATGSDPDSLKDYLGVFGTVGFDDTLEGGTAGCDLFDDGSGGGGCDDPGGGCDDTGGGGLGCTTVPTRMVTLFVLPLVVAGLRRRRRGASSGSVG